MTARGQSRARTDQRDGTRTRRAAAAADVRMADIEARLDDVDTVLADDAVGTGLRREGGITHIDVPALLSDPKRQFLEIEDGKLKGKQKSRVVDSTTGADDVGYTGDELFEAATFTNVNINFATILAALKEIKLFKE